MLQEQRSSWTPFIAKISNVPTCCETSLALKPKQKSRLRWKSSKRRTDTGGMKPFLEKIAATIAEDDLIRDTTRWAPCLHGRTRVLLILGRSLALHLLRRLVVAKRDEFRMAQMVGLGPSGIFKCPTNFGRSQRHSTIFAAVRPSSQRPLWRCGRLEKGQASVSRPLKRSKTFARDAGTKPLRTRAT